MGSLRSLAVFKQFERVQKAAKQRKGAARSLRKRMYLERKAMKMKLIDIVLKRPRNGTETKVTHRRVEVSGFYSISFPLFELVTYNRYIPIQTLKFTLLRNVIHATMFTASK